MKIFLKKIRNDNAIFLLLMSLIPAWYITQNENGFRLEEDVTLVNKFSTLRTILLHSVTVKDRNVPQNHHITYWACYTNLFW